MTQITAAELAGMTPDAINLAHHEGRLDTLLGVPQAEHDVIAKARGDQRLSIEDVRHLARLGQHELIVEASKSNRIDPAPDPTPPTTSPPQNSRPGYDVTFRA